MRLRCAPLAPGGDDLPLVDDSGAIAARLWRGRLRWRCADGALDLIVLALSEAALPDHEPTEPVAGAIARVLLALRAQSHAIGPTLSLLVAPAATLGADAIRLADGIRLFAIDSDEDEACWDAALACGMPVYGVRGMCVLDVARADGTSALLALGLGGFTCGDLELVELIEDRAGTRWRVAGADADAAVATVIVRGGFEAARIPGASGAWQDRGDEGSVRVVVRAPGGSCWTQPRFVAPRPAGHASGATHAC
ncbi:MAG TPA: hypothetical protein VEL07_04770 [Planctomycetota bacterium]|nr:hypothetical protein [Planctomycetota bacterium]